ncbi:hypothetical protein AAFF_G00337860 [Aldrovandia affinis]|uniref:Tumor necrosis factor receptor superfamily member 10B-like n=1 Tax=Aldrovandia affinis TaxID=143900 RepID=A0AAD7WQD7_9TELE|nr:hypothetical protein AAFF_G00337860 [Aldrovandia affinis]
MSRWDWGPHFKMFFIRNTVILLIVCLTLHVTAEDTGQGLNSLWNGEWNKTAPQIQCMENQQYAHDGLCCRNCEAGTYVKKPCVKALEAGTCAPCESGTYAEHATGMHRCLTCTPCHMDQEEMVPCSPTQNRQCQCRRGFFCEPDKPCEVCKKCTRCKEDEEKVKNCTTISNTICRKKQLSVPPAPTPPPTPTPSSPTKGTVAAVAVVSILLIGFALVLFYFWKRRPNERTETQSDPSGEVKIDMVDQSDITAENAADGQSAGTEEPRQESQPLLQETSAVGAKSSPVEDEDKGLGDSLPNTTNSSQTSLSALPTVPSCGSSPCDSPETHRQPPCRAEKDNRRLIPLNGEESLKKSFDLFDEFLDVQCHKRFFRSIGLSDNIIKNAENTHAEDKVYELLKAWMQRQGFRANINELLDELLNLDQKFSAESISSKAVAKGYYRYDEERN